ncbi:MAG: hypothetical protein MUO63_05470 [Desulfobulbaceae bacterium]|nr:hypothetical protein [Desulfobulbaceae bacterium]
MQKNAENIIAKLESLDDPQLDALQQITDKEPGKITNLFKTLLTGIASQKNIVRGNIPKLAEMS